MYKTTFILHTKYYTQLKKLSPEQVGQLTLGYFHYAETGVLPELEDAAADMLLSVICQQMDTDMQKYEETCRRRSEAASKAGKASAEKRSQKREYNETQLVSVYPGETPECITMQINENTYPTTNEEKEKFVALTQKLFRKCTNRQPTAMDMQNVFDNTHTRKELSDTVAIAAYDHDKAELLEYIFDIAAKNDKVNWNYIDGVYSNYAKRGIHTVMDAERDNWEHRYGNLG